MYPNKPQTASKVYRVRCDDKVDFRKIKRVLGASKEQTVYTVMGKVYEHSQTVTTVVGYLRKAGYEAYVEVSTFDWQRVDPSPSVAKT